MLGAHLTHIVFVVEEKVLVILTGITFAGWDRDRVQVQAVDLCTLQDSDVLEIGGGAHARSTASRSMALLVLICSLLDQPATSSGLSRSAV